AWEARQYAPMALGGVTAAWIAFRWLEDGGRRLAVLAGIVLLVTSFASESGLLVVAGLMLLPGRRTDTDAWWWRGAVAGAGILWLAAWGPVMVHQRALV